MITFYDCSTAPSPRRAAHPARRKRRAHTRRCKWTCAIGEQLSDAYRKINPHCTVPTLRTDDGLTLTDNAAITGVAGGSLPAAAAAGQHASRESRDRELALAHRVRRADGDRRGHAQPCAVDGQRALPGPVDYAQIPELAASAAWRVCSSSSVNLNERLAGRRLVAVGGSSIADIAAVVAVDFARVVKIKAGDEHLTCALAHGHGAAAVDGL